jgi:hypothetical protein
MSKNTDGNPGISELEALWQAKVQRAHARYRQTSTQLSRMTDELKRRPIEEPDGSFAVAKARRAEAAALYELSRTVLVYANLVFRGEIPSPDDDETLMN